MASRIVPEDGFRMKPFKTPRVKHDGHLAFIRLLPCVACLTTGLEISNCDAAHIRSASLIHGKRETGGGEKPNDVFTLPLCRKHHQNQHAVGRENNFWSIYHIDPFLLALVLWSLTGDEYAATEVIRIHAKGGV